MTRRARSSGRIVKADGYCATCGSDGVKVTWDRGAAAFFCDTCLPREQTAGRLSQETVEYNAYWDTLVEKHYGHKPNEPASLPERDPTRDQIYGLHIEDSRSSDGDFAVSCPCRGLLADGLTIMQARQTAAEHQHSP